MSFKCIRQLDSMQCGIACLSMISSHYGKPLSIKYLEQFCHTNIDGVSLLGISNCAKQIGFKPSVIATTISDIKRISHPCILHWNQNHFVVLYKYNSNKNRFMIADPGKGLLQYTESEFKNHWVEQNQSNSETGIVMLLEPSSSFSLDIVDNSSNICSTSFLFKYINCYKKHLLIIFLSLILGCILQLGLPFLTQWIVDLGIKNNDIKLIWLILLGELLIVIGKTSTDFIRRWLLMHISMRVNISLLSDFFIKLLKLPMSFFDSKLLGDLMQRISDHSRIQTFLTSQVLGMILTILSFIVFGIVLFLYNNLIFVIFLVGSLIYGIWISRFLSRRKILDYELFEQQAKNQNKTYELITSMQEIKLQNCEQRRRWEWEDTQSNLFYTQMKSLKLQQTQEAGSIFINEVKNIIITVFAATAVINGQMTLGSMLAVQYIIGQLNSPVAQFMAFIYSMQDVKISLERINEIHESKNEETDKNQYTSFNSIKSINIENIDFKYDPHALKATLENISFNIPDGKVTAIVGASGSGKTTLIKLMLGYYRVMSGKIIIAGRNINEYNLKWWRCHCGVVMQDGIIFSESIARNIAVDDGDIDIERLEKAARIANIHDYIMRLPLKYNTLIGRDGVGLSQGQKQRILIARAVYKNPDFIFLDEATNALDAKNEKVIVENLYKFYKGRTVIVVAHRLSTVKNADQIIVLDGGRVVEIGNHSSLIEKKGAYYNLVKNQLELGI